MNSKLPTKEMPSESSIKDTEVEYALILSQMIEVAEDNPSQLRLAIYEFARTKLVNNTLNATAADRDRLSKSLEAAIAGVEKFARLQGETKKRIVFRHGGAELSDISRTNELHSVSPASDPAAAPIQSRQPDRRSSRFAVASVVLAEMPAWARQLNWFAVSLSCLVAVIVLTVLTQGSTLWRNDKKVQSPSAQTSVAAETGSAATPSSNPSAGGLRTQSNPEMPLPDNYGVYLLNGSTLLELEALEIRVPDRRIEMSTPVSAVHQITIAEGTPRFLVYRRDLANDPPDKIEVRPLARVARVISFDQKGKPLFSPAASTWVIRNIAFEFRVRPVLGHPEILLVQAKDGAEELPSGRYVLTLKDKGFDFAVAGEATDPSQCVERTDAVNGSFYSDCRQR